MPALPPLERRERGRGIGRLAEAGRKPPRVDHREVDPLPEVRAHRVGRVADQPDPADVPRLRRRPVEDVVAPQPASAEAPPGSVGAESDWTVSNARHARGSSGLICATTPFRRSARPPGPSTEAGRSPSRATTNPIPCSGKNIAASSTIASFPQLTGLCLANYFADPVFRSSLGVTLVYTLLAVPLTVAIVITSRHVPGGHAVAALLGGDRPDDR